MKKEKIDLIGQLLTEKKLREIIHYLNGDAVVGVILSTGSAVFPSDIFSVQEARSKCINRIVVINKQLKEL